MQHALQYNINQKFVAGTKMRPLVIVSLTSRRSGPWLLIRQTVHYKCDKTLLPPKPSMNLGEIWPQFLPGEGRLSLHLQPWSAVRFRRRR